MWRFLQVKMLREHIATKVLCFWWATHHIHAPRELCGTTRQRKEEYAMDLEMLTEIGEDSLPFFDHLAMDSHGLRAVSCQASFLERAVCHAQDAQLEQGQRLLRRMRYERKLLRYCQKKAGRMGREFMVLHFLITPFPVSMVNRVNFMLLGSNCRCFHGTYGVIL